MNIRKIKKMLREAQDQNEILYARYLQINTLGMLSENWKKVVGTRTIYGEVHCKTNDLTRWNKVTASTEFKISKSPGNKS